MASTKTFSYLQRNNHHQLINNQQLTCQLLAWNEHSNYRQMPWKGEKDPYKIWLSEIILQQTRVKQGLDYYNRFLINYPNIFALANANDEAVYKLWEGLGYYNRCRNLLHTARSIVSEKKGIFPGSFEEIMQLKGVGSYTAAAISSFAFNLPHAVVDGNVMRVLARVFNIDKPIDTAEGKKLFSTLAQQLLDKKNPGLYNQAIMDFGATVCKPLLPLCTTCPLQNICKAYKTKKVNELPVKKKKLEIKNRWFAYIIINYGNQFLVHQRTAKDIWYNLFEFYLVEANSKVFWTKQKVQKITKEQLDIKTKDILFTKWFTQKLTHQTIHATFIKLVLQEKNPAPENYTWVTKEKLEQLALPKIINQYLQAEALQRSLF